MLNPNRGMSLVITLGTLGLPSAAWAEDTPADSGTLSVSVSNIQKGTKLFVVGELEISSFDGDDGNKRMTFKVIADTYRILGNGRRHAEKRPEAVE